MKSNQFFSYALGHEKNEQKQVKKASYSNKGCPY
jgi:hypothetical protein